MKYNVRYFDNYLKRWEETWTTYNFEEVRIKVNELRRKGIMAETKSEKDINK